ncbi:glycosyltransferase family 2 protein [Lysinibacillus yapensis]|uniref:Glycosyltransferase family 2 protein n=1 Tax=Ureibacillus yapensis TaxID=2304605 RepID=A0A396S741_9BACL|nr:glycosyltransferase family 2 protein [Lysinibacillus yapensis]RHW32788.1 glycosyltransferase family 2 protein [Lysinibacillus yapensis]
MAQVAVVIPAFNPLPSFIYYVKDLLQLEIETVVIVNDGSDEKYRSLFLELREIEGCTVIDHEENRGKGRALKSGFHYILNHLKKIESIMTVGAHGQHRIPDVQKLLHYAPIFSDGIILGVRNFYSKEVPLKNIVANRTASLLFSLLFHKRILDIQTGLRCVPRQALSWLLHVSGESFDYDSNMLVEALRRKVPIYEIAIGHYRIKKNSLMFYDEIMNSKIIIQQIMDTYLKNHGHQD